MSEMNEGEYKEYTEELGRVVLGHPNCGAIIDVIGALTDSCYRNTAERSGYTLYVEGGVKGFTELVNGSPTAIRARSEGEVAAACHLLGDVPLGPYRFFSFEADAADNRMKVTYIYMRETELHRSFLDAGFIALEYYHLGHPKMWCEVMLDRIEEFLHPGVWEKLNSISDSGGLCQQDIVSVILSMWLSTTRYNGFVEWRNNWLDYGKCLWLECYIRDCGTGPTGGHLSRVLEWLEEVGLIVRRAGESPEQYGDTIVWEPYFRIGFTRLMVDHMPLQLLPT